MPTGEQCVCCMEIKQFRSKLDEHTKLQNTTIKCITEHPGFEPLPKYLCFTVFIQYVQESPVHSHCTSTQVSIMAVAKNLCDNCAHFLHKNYSSSQAMWGALIHYKQKPIHQTSMTTYRNQIIAYQSYIS